MARTSKTPYSSFPRGIWPQVDQELFGALQGDGRRFSGTSKSNRKQHTWKGLEYTYRTWLGFVSDRYRHLLCDEPGARMTKETLEGYIGCLQATCSDMTIAIHLQRLYLLIRELAPNRDFEWVYIASRRLFKRAKTRPKGRLNANALLQKGLEMMQRARQEAADWGYVTDRAAMTFRKGLEIAFLSFIPERRRAIQSLRIGKTIVKNGRAWSLRLSPEHVKGGKSVNVSIPKVMWPWISEYVDRFRPEIAGADRHDGFWASRNGTAMHANTIYQSLTRSTQAELGIAVSPHDFRRAVATRWSERAGNEPTKAQLHLGHASPGPTVRHYIDAPERAGTALIDALARYR